VLRLAGQSLSTLPNNLQQLRELYAAANRQDIITACRCASPLQSGGVDGVTCNQYSQHLRHCRLNQTGDLCVCKHLLLADLAWNDIHVLPDTLPTSLVSLNLSHNSLCNLASTLTTLTPLVKLRDLHLKVCIFLQFASTVMNHKRVPACTVSSLPISKHTQHKA